MKNYELKTKQDHQHYLELQSYLIDGIYYWKSNDHPVPSDFMTKTVVGNSARQILAIEKNTVKFLKEYRESRKNYKYSEEELFEMRAAFGEGEIIVDVITGQEIQL